MSKNKVKKIVKNYAAELRANSIPFAHIYLYGSYAEGKVKKYSDIDVAVIVQRIGSPRQYLNKKMRLWELTTLVDPRIEPILLESKDFRTKTSILAQAVRKTGLKIK